MYLYSQTIALNTTLYYAALCLRSLLFFIHKWSCMRARFLLASLSFPCVAKSGKTTALSSQLIANVVDIFSVVLMDLSYTLLL